MIYNEHNEKNELQKSFCLNCFSLLCSYIACFAFVDIRPSISFYGGSAFCIPTSSYLKEYPGLKNVKMPAFRTSANFGMDLKALELGIGDERRILFWCWTILYKH